MCAALGRFKVFHGEPDYSTGLATGTCLQTLVYPRHPPYHPRHLSFRPPRRTRPAANPSFRT